jgi:hypothetical protein
MKWQGSRGQKVLGFCLWWGIYAAFTGAVAGLIVPVDSSGFEQVYTWIVVMLTGFLGWWWISKWLYMRDSFPDRE